VRKKTIERDIGSQSDEILLGKNVGKNEHFNYFSPWTGPFSKTGTGSAIFLTSCLDGLTGLEPSSGPGSTSQFDHENIGKNCPGKVASGPRI
jgi:hypothetical protein